MGIGRNSGHLEIIAGGHPGHGRITIFCQPAIDMHVVGVGITDAGVEKEEKGRVLSGLRKDRPGND